MSSHRALEVIFGVVTLVSVVSVPVPRRTSPVPPPAVRVDVQRIEELRRVSQAQRADVARLTRDTQALANLLQRWDGGTVASHAPRTVPPQLENEEHECSQ